MVTSLEDMPKLDYNVKLMIDGNKEGRWITDGFRESNVASLKTDGILNNVARNLADVVERQDPAYMPNTNASGEAKFTPEVSVGGVYVWGQILTQFWLVLIKLRLWRNSEI